MILIKRKKTIKYHNVGTVLQSSKQIIDRGKTDVLNTHIHDRSKRLNTALNWILSLSVRSVCRYQRSNQNPYIEEEQKTQRPKEKNTKGQTMIYKTYI